MNRENRPDRRPQPGSPAHPSDRDAPVAVLADYRPAVSDVPAHRLLVLGWSPETMEALAALEATGRYEGTGVVDPSSAALVGASQVTRLPCHRDVGRVLQDEHYDAVLLHGPYAAEAADSIARRGAHIMLLADTSDAAALDAVREATGRYATRVTVLRPALLDAGIADILAWLTPGYPTGHVPTPRLLDVTMEAATDPARLLANAVAFLARAIGHREVIVQADAWGTPVRAIDLRVETDGWLTRVYARHAPDPFMRITADSERGALELRSDIDGTMVTHTRADGHRSEHEPAPVDQWRAEAERAALLDTADDHSWLHGESALMDAVTRSIVSGEAQATDCCTRPGLRVLAGGGRSSATRSTELHLVVS